VLFGKKVRGVYWKGRASGGEKRERQQNKGRGNIDIKQKISIEDKSP